MPHARPHRLLDTLEDEDPFPELDGDSPAMAGLKRDMLRVARDGYVSALILGESGTGKERVARAIHRLSPRAGLPFVVVNCAGLSSTLAEDELFGHVRGAFTGAIGDQPGPFERANGGTVFLDEVGELSPGLQLKLLRALQQRSVQRLGSGRETPFNVRVIAATNADLTLARRRREFREDLYYRLKVYELHVPPLRRRGPRDLRQLVDAILKGLRARRQRPPASLDSVVWNGFVRYAWPGNVRELENTLERMIVAAGEESVLCAAHLPDGFAVRPDAAPTVVVRALPSPAEARLALGHHRFHRGRTAAALGLSRHQLYRLLKHHAALFPPAGSTSACSRCGVPGCGVPQDPRDAGDPGDLGDPWDPGDDIPHV
jgi:two-component system response regulator HydG